MRTVWRCGTNHFSTMSASRSRSSLLQSLGLCFALGACLCACGGGGGASTGGGGGSTATQYPQPPSGSASLTQSDVAMLVEAAAQTANSDAMSIAVVDRLGNILAVWQGPTAPPTSAGNYGTMVPTGDLAVSLARTAAFFSNDQAPLSSRTVRYISGIHFPPGIANTPNAALYGIENTNRGCLLSANYIPGQEIPPATAIDGSPDRLGIITGKADSMDSQPLAVNPGGVPVFKSGHVVGGIGIAGVPLDVAEYVAYAAAGMFAMSGPKRSHGSNWVLAVARARSRGDWRNHGAVCEQHFTSKRLDSSQRRVQSQLLCYRPGGERGISPRRLSCWSGKWPSGRPDLGAGGSNHNECGEHRKRDTSGNSTAVRIASAHDDRRQRFGRHNYRIVSNARRDDLQH